MYAAQRELVKRHYEAKSKIDGISGIGGGISLWPAMDDMRLSGSDTVRLAVLCVVLAVATLTVFYSFHGSLCQCVFVNFDHHITVNQVQCWSCKPDTLLQKWVWLTR